MESSLIHIISKVILHDLHDFGIDLNGATKNETMKDTDTEQQGSSEPRVLMEMHQQPRNSTQERVSQSP